MIAVKAETSKTLKMMSTYQLSKTLELLEGMHQDVYHDTGYEEFDCDYVRVIERFRTEFYTRGMGNVGLEYFQPWVALDLPDEARAQVKALELAAAISSDPEEILTLCEAADEIRAYLQQVKG